MTEKKEFYLVWDAETAELLQFDDWDKAEKQASANVQGALDEDYEQAIFVCTKVLRPKSQTKILWVPDA